MGLKTWDGVGHNDVQLLAGAEHAKLVAALLAEALEFNNEHPTGALVEAHSLSNPDFNGLKGKVVGPQAGGERIRVLFPDPNGEKALKPANLKVVDRKPPPPPEPFPAGSTVEAHSLAGAPEFNGRRGKVLGPQGDRIRVQFADGEKALRPANLKVVEAAEDAKGAG